MTSLNRLNRWLERHLRYVERCERLAGGPFDGWPRDSALRRAYDRWQRETFRRGRTSGKPGSSCPPAQPTTPREVDQ